MRCSPLGKTLKCWWWGFTARVREREGEEIAKNHMVNSTHEAQWQRVAIRCFLSIARAPKWTFGLGQSHRTGEWNQLRTSVARHHNSMCIVYCMGASLNSNSKRYNLAKQKGCKCGSRLTNGERLIDWARASSLRLDFPYFRLSFSYMAKSVTVQLRRNRLTN